MKRLVLAALALALVVPVFAAPALADPTVATKVSPGTMAIPTTTIYGRPNKPMVSIVIRPASAAAEAGAAHEHLRQSILIKSQPASMR